MSLWKHECIRVISDRFTNQSDKDWFEKTMKRVIGEELGEDQQAMIEDMPYLVDFLRLVVVNYGLSSLKNWDHSSTLNNSSFGR